MKKTFFVSVLITTLAFAAQAQQPPMQGKTPQERANNQTNKWKKDLSLAPDQSAKLNTLLLNKEQQAEAIKAKYAASDDKKAMHAEMKPIHDQFDTSLKQLLTPDQYTSHTTMKQQRKEQHGQ